MTYEIDHLTNEAAVKTVSKIAESWLENEGLGANIILEKTRELSESYIDAVKWAKIKPSPDKKTGDLARHIIRVLIDSRSPKVKAWTDKALEEVTKTKAYALDPLSLLIGGGILIGAILASRVRKIGPVEFYKGIPEEMKDVLKAASHVQFPQ